MPEEGVTRRSVDPNPSGHTPNLHKFPPTQEECLDLVQKPSACCVKQTALLVANKMSHISPHRHPKTVLLKPGHTDTLTNGHFHSPLLKTSKPQNQSKPKKLTTHIQPTHPRPHPFCNCAKIEETHNPKQHPNASQSLLHLLPPENCGSPLVPCFSSCDPFPNPLLLRTLFAAVPLPSSAPQSPVCSLFFFPSFFPSFFLSFFVSFVPCFPAGLPLLALAVGVVVAPAFSFLSLLRLIACATCATARKANEGGRKHRRLRTKWWEIVSQNYKEKLLITTTY